MPGGVLSGGYLFYAALRLCRRLRQYGPGQAGIERRCIDKRLESRTGGPVLHRVIELACPIVPAPNQGQHLPCVGIQRYQRNLGIDKRRVVPCFDSARMKPFHLRVNHLHAFGHRIRRYLLQIRIQRRVDAQAFTIEIRVPQVLHQPVAHQVDKIWRLARIDVDRRKVEWLSLGDVLPPAW